MRKLTAALHHRDHHTHLDHADPHHAHHLFHSPHSHSHSHRSPSNGGSSSSGDAHSNVHIANSSTTTGSSHHAESRSASTTAAGTTTSTRSSSSNGDDTSSSTNVLRRDDDDDDVDDVDDTRQQQQQQQPGVTWDLPHHPSGSDETDLGHAITDGKRTSSPLSSKASSSKHASSIAEDASLSISAPSFAPSSSTRDSGASGGSPPHHQNSTTSSSGTTTGSGFSLASMGLHLPTRSNTSRSSTSTTSAAAAEERAYHLRELLKDHEPSDDPVNFVVEALTFVWCKARKGSKAATKEPSYQDIRDIIVPMYYDQDFKHNSNGDWESLRKWLDKIETNRQRANSIRIRLLRGERERSQRHKRSLKRVSVFLHLENIVEPQDGVEEPARINIFLIAQIENGKIVEDHAVYDMSPMTERHAELNCSIM